MTEMKKVKFQETHIIITVKAPNIVHLSLLTSVGYNKKETKSKKCAQPNKVITIYTAQSI